ERSAASAEGTLRALTAAPRLASPSSSISAAWGWSSTIRMRLTGIRALYACSRWCAAESWAEFWLFVLQNDPGLAVFWICKYASGNGIGALQGILRQHLLRAAQRLQAPIHQQPQLLGEQRSQVEVMQCHQYRQFLLVGQIAHHV